MSWKLYSKRDFNLSNKDSFSSIGPGYYDVSSTVGNPKSMYRPFGIGAKNSSHEQSTPGPGYYEPKKLESANNGYSSLKSKTKRTSFDKVDTNPAPTAYSEIKSWNPEIPPVIHHVCKETPKFPSPYIGQQNVEGYIEGSDGQLIPKMAETRGPDSLGPGTYDPAPLPDTKLPINLKTHSTREPYPKSDAPGPGRYDLWQYTTKIPHQIGDRHAPVRKSAPLSDAKFYQGPIQWAEFSSESNAVFKNHAERVLLENPCKDNPPPGAYETTISTFPTPGINSLQNTRQRIKPKSVNSLSLSLKHPQISNFGKKSDNSERLSVFIPETPGPGTYNFTPTWIKRAFGKGPLGRRALDASKDDSDIPGPGSYEVEIPKKLFRKSSVFSGNLSRMPNVHSSNNPGPGSYDPYSKFSETNSEPTIDPNEKFFSLQRKTAEVRVKTRIVQNGVVVGAKNPPSLISRPKREHGNWLSTFSDTPPPGSYDVTQGIDHSKFKSIGEKESEKEDDEDLPGPGYYNVTHDDFYKHSFNSSIPPFSKLG